MGKKEEKEKNEWLDEADAIVIECEEANINPHSLASITPFYDKTIPKIKGGQKIMTLKEAFAINKRQIAKGQNLIDYLKTRIGKKGIFEGVL